jgi:hypothetical protein
MGFRRRVNFAFAVIVLRRLTDIQRLVKKNERKLGETAFGFLDYADFQ